MDNPRKLSAHRELKQRLKRKKNRQRQKDQTRKRPKRACSGYILFVKEIFDSVKKANPRLSTRDLNIIIGNKWSRVSAGEKERYKRKGKADFQEKIARWNSLRSSR